jgi:carbonic anhydrase/acetyltransferase-like protein (isoleucine patch superfamily)
VAIYALGDKVPDIHPAAYVHPDAVIIGSVTLGPESSVWPCAVLRGDDGFIRIGARTSIQDGTIVHCTAALPTVLGDECVVGHNAHLEGCTIEDGALVGSGSVVLHKAVVRSGGLVAANAVVTGGTEVPSGALAVGIPAKIREGGADSGHIVWAMHSYVERSVVYRRDLRRLD